MQTSDSSPLSVAVYSHGAQGFYFGELIGQLQQLCVVKGYRFTFIDTRTTGRYKLTLGINRFDIVIVLLNAVHPELIEKMQQAGKAIVSIGFDYFPLEVPLISSDNNYGLELAFNHLIKNGHQKIAFVGDIRQFDIRKRYEAFCEQHEINGFALEEEQIFVVKDALFTGGFSAAEEFLKRNSDISGVICATGLTAIGFARKLKSTNPQLLECTEIVAFDAISAFGFAAEGICIVDQNLFLIAHRALEVGEKIVRQKDVERQELVLPKLLDAKSEHYQTGDAFLATSAELSELHNPNYMKAIMSHFYEWPQTISANNLENIMMLEPLFPRFVNHIVLARVSDIKHTGTMARVIRHFSCEGHDGSLPTSGLENNGMCIARDYPCNMQTLPTNELKTAIHVPIWVKSKLWGVLSVFGAAPSSSVVESSFTSLCGYINTIVYNLEHNLTLKAHKSSPQSKPETVKPTSIGLIHWNIDEVSQLWDTKAMALLGFESELEQHVYKHMELSDRVHPDDEHTLQELMRLGSMGDTKTTIRLRHKNKSYPWFDISCKANTSGRECTFQLTLQQESHD